MDKFNNQFRKIFEMAYGISNSPGRQKTITQNELVEYIKKYEQMKPGANFFSLTQVTKETTRVAKDQIPFILPGLKNGKTFFAKVTQVNGQFGANYQKSVNRQREKEGKEQDFTAQRSQYDSLDGSKVLQTLGDNIYIYYRPINVAKRFKPTLVRAINNNPSIESDFETVSRDFVAQYKSPSRGTGFYQGVDSAVEVRKISLSSVAAININGTEFIVIDIDPVRKAIYEAAGAPMPIDVEI